MASGDTAAQAGLPLVSGTSKASDIDDMMNDTRDMIGRIKLDHPRKITVAQTAPASPQVGDVWIKRV